MFEHHRQTIENLKGCYEAQDDCLALLIIGSVARGDAGETSDVDFYLVVTEQVYQDCEARNAGCVDAHEHSVSPCTEANGYLTSLPALQALRDRGNEMDRWMFSHVLVVFCKDEAIEKLVGEIAQYPEAGRIRRMESFHSQIYYHVSFFEFAFLSQTKYLIYETATKLILSIGRLILADNRILYPNRKWFFRELRKAPDQPEGLCQTIEAFLDAPTIAAGHALIEMVERHKEYPLPPEGMKARINRESILNLEEW